MASKLVDALQANPDCVAAERDGLRDRIAPAYHIPWEMAATAPEILGKAAQSEFLSSGRVLSRRARARAEQALAVDPMQAAALATMGMAAFEEADYRQAIVYWQRLRELEPSSLMMATRGLAARTRISGAVAAISHGM